MKINCAQSMPDLTITKADGVGSGYLLMIYPTSVSLSLIYEDPEASEKHCHCSKNTITPCAAPAARLGRFFWQAWHLAAGALQSSLCLLLPFPTRCSHTSPTAGVQVSAPSLAERTSPCRTPPLQFTWSWSQPISALPCNFVTTAQQRRGPWAQIGLPTTTVGVCVLQA